VEEFIQYWLGIPCCTRLKHYGMSGAKLFIASLPISGDYKWVFMIFLLR
jgi:hypothetical protein